jgi:uncharacterized protein (DUF697 family)
MPLLKGKAGGALGAVGQVRNFMNLVKEIDFDEVRERAEQPPRTLVIAADTLLAEDAASQLFGSETRNGVELKTWTEGDSLDGSRWDAIVVYDPAGAGVLDKVRKTIGARKADHVFFLAQRQPGGNDPVTTIRAEIASELTDLAPSYGRFYADWRPAAVSAVIDDASKANAQFALVSNIPAVVPFFGGIVAASADLIVLTKNQVMMCYKIAAAHDRDLGNQMAILRELVPVVGGGFLWRTIAREAAAFIPLAAGTIPKVAIAYAGTIATGRAADYYYRFGRKPSKEQLKTFALQAGEAAKRLSLPGREKEPSGDHSENGRQLDDTQKIDVGSSNALRALREGQ